MSRKNFLKKVSGVDDFGDHIRVVSNSISTTGRGRYTLCESTNKNEPFGARRQGKCDVCSCGDELCACSQHLLI